jgi:hypothetical protein
MYGYSNIGSVAEFLQKLQGVIVDVKNVTSDYPTDTALQSILKQLEATEQWTRGGQPLSLEQKGRLNFGLLTSKYLDEIDSDLAQRIYNIAEFITYWN